MHTLVAFCGYFVSLGTLSFRLTFLWHLSLLFPHCSWKFQCMIQITFYLTVYQLINIWVVYISFCYYEQECTMWIIMYNHGQCFINKYFYSHGVYLHGPSRSCNNTTFRFWRNCQRFVPNTQHHSTFSSAMYMSEFLQTSPTVTFENDISTAALKTKGRRHN